MMMKRDVICDGTLMENPMKGFIRVGLFVVLLCIFIKQEAEANEFYDYTIIAETKPPLEPLVDGDITIFSGGSALNNNGVVAFYAKPKEGNGSRRAVFKGSGGPLSEIFSNIAPNEPLPSQGTNASLGINDNGEVAFTAQNFLNSSSPRIAAYKGDGGPIGLMWDSRTNSIHTPAAFNLNNNGHVPFQETIFGSIRLLSTDGVTIPILNQSGVSGGFSSSGLVINNPGQVALLDRDGGATNFTLRIYTAQEAAKEFIIGQATEWGSLHTVNCSPGFNDLAAVSFSSDGPAEKKVVFVNEAGVSTVAEVNSVFASFTNLGGQCGGTNSLNNNNQVAFMADLVGGGEGIFVNGPSGDAPVPILTTRDLINGKNVTRLGRLFSDSQNDAGQIAFKVHFDDDSTAIVRADPKPGVTPGAPILPSNDISTGDPFELIIPQIPVPRIPPPPGGGVSPIPVPPRSGGGGSGGGGGGSGGGSGFSCRRSGNVVACTGRTYLDPPLATGYNYWVNDISPNIESVLIPAPLPGGDDAFEVQFGGTSHVLTAASTFFFTDHVPEGVREFTISGIDEAEALSPTDPVAFVTGLTFVDLAPVGSTLFMDPIVVGEVDIVAPQVFPPADFIQQATGPSTPILDLGLATATDNVGVVSGPNPSTTGPFTVGIHTIIWSASDAAGNVGEANQTVTVVDTTPPTVTLPPDITTPATGPLTPVTLGLATANDLVDGPITPTPSTTGPFPPGITEVGWTAADALGNSVTAIQRVTVVTFGFDPGVIWARAKLEPGDPHKLKVRGNMVLPPTGNGIDPANEDVTLKFGSYTETIPAGSFLPKGDRWVYKAPKAEPFSGIKQIVLRDSTVAKSDLDHDDGEYKIKLKGVDLSGIDFSIPVPFSIQIGDDVGHFNIPFDNGKPDVKSFDPAEDKEDEDDEVDEHEFEEPEIP